MWLASVYNKYPEIRAYLQTVKHFSCVGLLYEEAMTMSGQEFNCE